MASAKALFGAAFGRFFFRDATVTKVEAIGETFRLAELEGEALRGVTWTPGDKVQVFLPNDGMRTYTPISWDAQVGKTSFLLYVHGDVSAPGAKWARELVTGAACQFFGPRGSIGFPSLAPDVTFFGDETSFAAAAALQSVRAAARNVFEVENAAGSRKVLRALGIEATLVERTAGDAHVDALAAALQNTPPESLVFTGRAQTIQALRARGLRPAKTKAYWSVGKTGLD